MTRRCEEERIAHSLFFASPKGGVRGLLIFFFAYLLDFFATPGAIVLAGCNDGFDNQQIVRMRKIAGAILKEGTDAPANHASGARLCGLVGVQRNIKTSSVTLLPSLLRPRNHVYPANTPNSRCTSLITVCSSASSNTCSSSSAPIRNRRSHNVLILRGIPPV